MAGKSKVGALEATAQYIKNKLPQSGFFSTLDELISNAPFEKAPIEQWRNYLQPGRTFEREGVRFPLKKEEIDYSGLLAPSALDEVGRPITKDELRRGLQTNRPDLQLEVGLEGSLGSNRLPSPYQRFPQEAGLEASIGSRLAPKIKRAIYSDYAYQTLPGGYEESITTSPDIGSYPTHFNPGDISHSRSTIQKTADQKLMRLIEEIQSDRHQAAAEKVIPTDWANLMTPEQEEQWELLWSQGRDREARALEDEIKKSAPRRGYRTPEMENERSDLLAAKDDWDRSAGGTPAFMENRLRDLNRIPPDAPFKDPADYGMLELKQQLLHAAKQGQSYLGLVSGEDVSKRFSQNERTSAGTSHVYDQVYPAQLQKLARQYGIPMAEVKARVQAKGDIATPTMRSLETENIPDFLDMIHSHIQDSYGEGNEIPRYVDDLINELEESTGWSREAREARRELMRARTLIENDKYNSDDFREHWQGLKDYLMEMHNEHRDLVRSNQGTRTFSALQLDPETRDKILRVGVPIWSLGTIGVGASLMNPEGGKPGFAEGGEVKKPIATRLGELARKVGPTGGAEPRARVAAGFASQVLGGDNAGLPSADNPIFVLDPTTGEVRSGWRPGMLDELLSIPTLGELVGLHVPEWAKAAQERTDRLRSLIRRQMGLRDPQGFAENADEALGTMLGQIPVPATKMREAGPLLKEARELGKTAAASPLEYILPTINPTPENYAVGTVAGGILGSLADPNEESPPPVKKAEGGAVKESLEPLQEMFDRLQSRYDELSFSRGGFAKGGKVSIVERLIAQMKRLGLDWEHPSLYDEKGNLDIDEAKEFIEDHLEGVRQTDEELENAGLGNLQGADLAKAIRKKITGKE